MEDGRSDGASTQDAQDDAQPAGMTGDEAEDAAPLGFGFSTLPPWIVASREFQDHPRALHIVGVRRENRSLFKLLDSLSDPVERGELFDEYMTSKFRLDEWAAHDGAARRSLKNSYVRFLRGWGFDSNSIEGAVLKGWVESRIGIPPCYHGRRVEPGQRSYLEFARQRMQGHARTNAIDAQLDLVYEFCQYELKRRGQRRLVLYRGVHEGEEQHALARRGDGEFLVRLNNLCSFTADVEKAWEFGATVLRANVPTQRVLYFAGLLPHSILRGEDEYLVFGREHWVSTVRV